MARYLPSVLAAALLVAWYIHQRREVASLAADIAGVRGRIAEAGRIPRSGKGPPAPKMPPPTSARTSPKPAASLEWRHLADQVALSEKPGSERPLDQKFLDDLEERLSSMTRDELVAALDEIADLRLDPKARIKLENEFIEPVAEKDPAYALAKFSDRIHDDPDDAGLKLSPAIAAWAKQNPRRRRRLAGQGIRSGLVRNQDAGRPQRPVAGIRSIARRRAHRVRSGHRQRTHPGNSGGPTGRDDAADFPRWTISVRADGLHRNDPHAFARGRARWAVRLGIL